MEVHQSSYISPHSKHREYVDGSKDEEENQMGQHRSLLSTRLAEFMWRRKFGEQPLENLIRSIHEKYPLV